MDKALVVCLVFEAAESAMRVTGQNNVLQTIQAIFFKKPIDI